MNSSCLLPIFLVLTASFTGESKAFKRAAPPKFDKATASLFENDAFALLKGERTFVAAKNEEIKADVESEEPAAGGDYDRTDMMLSLDAALKSAAEGLSDKRTLDAASHKVARAADIVIMMGGAMFHNDPDYGLEEGFLKSAQEMTTAAKQMKFLSQKGDHEAASSALNRIKKNCASCHDEFRL